MAEIHKCGQGWAYCDGNCTTCAVNNYYTTNGTITLVKDYPPYLDYPKERKRQTNAEKYFRNATDEELADWCYEHQEDCLGCPALRKGCMNFGKACKDAWLNWLKQEAESDNH